jgi:hypothetical protein
MALRRAVVRCGVGNWAEEQGIVFGRPRFARLVRAEVVSPETSRRSSVRLH